MLFGVGEVSDLSIVGITKLTTEKAERRRFAPPPPIEARPNHHVRTPALYSLDTLSCQVTGAQGLTNSMYSTTYKTTCEYWRREAQ
jgi:hypothetical protein